MRSSILTLFAVAVFVPFLACNQAVTEEETATGSAGIDNFTGHWTLDIEGTWVGWLGVSQEEGYLDAELLWKWGSVSPVANVFLADDRVLHVTRTSARRRAAAEGDQPRTHMVTNWMEAQTDGENIYGYFLEPADDGLSVDSTWFEGVKLPDVPPAPNLDAVEYDDPVELFNGTDLSGWELIEDHLVNGWVAKDGVLLNDARQEAGEPRISYGNLRTVDEFEDFNLKLEVNVPEGSNSGIYLRGIYEIQILDSYGREPNDHNMGALYSRITPSEAAEKPAGEWQTMDITLVDRHVTVILNEATIIDNQPVYGPTGGALHSDVFAPGPIFLQGDHGPVSFRNIVLTPVAD